MLDLFYLSYMFYDLIFYLPANLNCPGYNELYVPCGAECDTYCEDLFMIGKRMQCQPKRLTSTKPKANFRDEVQNTTEPGTNDTSTDIPSADAADECISGCICSTGIGYVYSRKY